MIFSQFVNQALLSNVSIARFRPAGLEISFICVAGHKMEWDLPEEEERISNIDSQTSHIILKLRPRCLHTPVFMSGAVMILKSL